MFKSALTLFAVVAGVAKRLPLFQPASIERELEQTLCLIRCCRQQREKAVAPVEWRRSPFRYFPRH
jgi:hypothetical protein